MTPPAAAGVRARAEPTPGPRRLAPTRPPRRVSGPARGKRPVARGATPAAPAFELAPRLRALAAAVSERRLLDHLIRGRAWIALVAFALIGIVTLQLGLLQLNSRIGRALTREAALARENSSLSVEDSNLSAPERIEALAARDGMSPAPESSLRFLQGSSAATLARAAGALSSPAGSQTQAALSSQQPAASTASAQEPETAATTAAAGGEAAAAPAEGAAQAPAAGAEAGTGAPSSTGPAQAAGATSSGPAQEAAASPSGGTAASEVTQPAPVPGAG